MADAATGHRPLTALGSEAVEAEQVTRPVGGQAVPGGVMMRGEHSWALALRRADGGIDVEVHPNRGWAVRYERIPLVRGLAAVVESVSLGLRTLRTATNKTMPEDRQLTQRRMAVTAAVAIPFAIGLFVVLPAVFARLLADGDAFHLADAALRLAILVGYIAAVGTIPDIRSVFQYHGAEHKAVAAYEAGAPLTADGAAGYGTQHVRCGTNFLLTIAVVTTFTNALVGRPGWAVLVATRIVLVPLVAAIAYEWLRFASRHLGSPLVQALLVPGLALQRLTTREPSREQLEVAMTALVAVLAADAEPAAAGSAVLPAAAGPSPAAVVS
jgi:uncharacterized protein YqhQ